MQTNDPSEPEPPQPERAAGADAADDGAASSRTRLREVVADCLEQMELTGDRAIEEACARHPELADRIRRRLQRLRDHGFSPAGTPAPSWKVPESLGDFDLGERIGAGGMGVVYHARQRSLSRDVALKLMRPELQEMAGPQSRFRREIEAVSRLQHPSIVQIHAVGDDTTIPFFAMEYVRGCTVAAVLERLKERAPQELTGDDFWATVKAATETSGRACEAGIDTRLRGRSWVETCLLVMQQAAGAIDHAHRRGVLHRDLKPQNIMVTPEGRVVVMDFGLAVTEGSERLTRSGAEIGSLIYMAPEQVRGQHDAIREMTDVYGLGVTLFEMLTLRPAFGSGSQESIRRRILDGEFATPRTLVPSLPWDTETVCLVAMEKEPARRYANAAAFAEDLDRILRHRPIEARRLGLPLRARRWIERHPAAAVALFLMSVLTAVSIAAAIQQRNANRATGRALEDVRQQSDRARRNLARAQKAVDLMLTRFADTHLKNVPQFEQIRRSLLEDALSLQREMLTEEGGDPAVQRDAAAAYDRLSAVQQMLGNQDEALDSLAHALQIREEIVRDDPGEFLLLDQIALGHHDLGNTFRDLGRWEDSERHFQKAIAASEAALRDHPGEAGFEHTLARSLNDYAITLEEQSRFEEAIASCRRAFTLVEPRAQRNLCNASLLNEVAAALQTQGLPLTQLGRFAEAVACLQQAKSWRERIVALDPKDPQHRRQLGLLHYQQSFTLHAAGEIEEASDTIQEALDLQRALVKEYPSAAGIQWDLAQSLNQQGMVLKDRLDAEGAATSYREALRWYEPLVAASPEVPGYSHELGWTLSNLAVCILEQGEDAEAQKLVRRAIDLQTACIEKGPTIRIYQDRLLEAFRLLRDLHVARGDFKSAVALTEQSGQIPFVEGLRGPVARFNAATLVRGAELALKASTASAEAGNALADEYSARARKALQAAATAPATARDTRRDDPDLEYLSRQPEFAELLAPATRTGTTPPPK